MKADETSKHVHEGRVIEYLLREMRRPSCHTVRLDGRWQPYRSWPDFFCFDRNVLMVVEVSRLVPADMEYEGLVKSVRRDVIPKLPALPGVYALQLTRGIAVKSILRSMEQLIREISVEAGRLALGAAVELTSVQGVALRKLDATGEDRFGLIVVEPPWQSEEVLPVLRDAFLALVGECVGKFTDFGDVRKVLAIDSSGSTLHEPIMQLPVSDWMRSVADAPVDDIWVLAGGWVELVRGARGPRTSVLKGHRFENEFRYAYQAWP